MTILAGVCAFDDRPVDREVAALDAYAREHGGVAIVSRGTVSAAVDGFLDDVSPATHAVLHAYERHGTSFPSRLVGDFAVALWDASERTLVLARDAFGSRPLYYVANAHRIAWASHLAPLLGLLDTAADVDDDYFATFLGRGAIGDATPIRQIRCVPAASMVIVRNGELRVVRHWRLDPHARIDVRSDEEAEERLRGLFFEAVHACVRGEKSASVLLSGGVDSSSIACAADVATSLRVQGISYVFEQSQTSDERDYVKAVEEHRGLRGVYIGEREQALLELDLDDDRLELPTAYASFAKRNAATREAMRRTGSRVLLTGIGGDDVLYGDFGYIGCIADALSRGNVVAAASQVRTWAPVTGQSYAQLLWQSGIRPLLPAKLRARHQRPLATWWDDDFVRRTRLAEKFEPDRGPGILPSRRFDLACFDSLVASMAQRWYLEHDEIVTRQPFLHRPLVEFCFALPFEQKLRPGETRSILRRALRDLLPPKILRRVSKSGPDEAVLRATQQRGPAIRALFADGARVVRHGFVDAHRMTTALQQASHGVQVNTPALVRLIALELWLRWFERRPRRPAASPPILSGGQPWTTATFPKSIPTTFTRPPASSSSATPPS